MSCLLGDAKTSASAASQANNKINNNSLNIKQNLSLSSNTSSSGPLNTSPQETCLICGDVASGKHYGLRSCEACKAFFKRTVQGKIEYSCPATRECEINKRRRKACQACRFQKCLNMGMLKEGVRLDRVRGGRQKYRRGLSPTGTAGSMSGGTISDSNQNHHNYHHNLQQSSCSHAQPNAEEAGSSETQRIMTALINCEPEELTTSPTNLPTSLSVQMKTLHLLSDLFDRELVSLIGWAKQIPGFSETITLNDQMRLLQTTWAEVIALSIGYRSHLKQQQSLVQQQQQHHLYGNNGFMNTTPSPTSSSPASTTSSFNINNNSTSSSSYSPGTEIRLVFAKDLIIDFKHALACGADAIFYNCVQLIKRLDHLKITPKEYIILKAISLTNADVRLENPQATHQLRDLLMDTLYEVTSGECSANNSINNNSATSSIGSNIKIEPQDRSLGQLNQYALASTPLRPLSSVPSPPASRTIMNHRFHQVLLCLPVLRQTDWCIRKFWNDVRKGPNHVPMNKLFEEMLEPCQRIYKSSAEM